MDRFGDKVICNPTVKLSKGEFYPLIDIEKITPGLKSVCSDELVEYVGQSGSKFNDNDVLMARITPCLENGKLAIARTDGKSGTGSTELFVFRGKEGVTETDYIYYLLSMSHMRQLAANSMTGASGRQRADLGFIKRIQWDFPDIRKQKRIVEKLSAFDSLIELNNKRIKLLEQMAENLYKEWFVRFRFPGHENVELENGIPKGWKVESLVELATIKAGGDKPKTFSIDFSVETPVPVYSNGIDNDGLYGFTDKAEILHEGVTISARGTVGFVCYHRHPFVPIVRLIVLVPKTFVSALYLYYYLRLDGVIGNGTSQQQITIPMVNKKRIIVPDKAIVESFDNVVIPLWDEIDSLKVSIDNLRKQRDLLLPRLMSGKLEI